MEKISVNYEILANVNPLRPNDFIIVDNTSRYSCPVQDYLSIVTKLAKELRSKGFRVLVKKSVVTYIDF